MFPVLTFSVSSWGERRWLREPEKKGGARGAAKFREETSKKADSAVKDRIAATHNLGEGSFVCKRYFAAQHRNGVDNSATGE
jgi:hypothetical protein